MTDKQTQARAPESNLQRDPDDWVTGNEPMTGAQRSYLKTLSEEARQPFDETLSKAEASKRIDELQAVTGRGEHGAERSTAEESPAEESPADQIPRNESPDADRRLGEGGGAERGAASSRRSEAPER